MPHRFFNHNRQRSRRPQIPLRRYLMRRRVARVWGTVLGTVLLGGLVAADRGGFLLNDGGDWGRYEGRSFRVTRVIDGDTLEVAAPDGALSVTRIRLWGVDTPEIAKPDSGRPAEPFAEDAAAYARGLCQGQTVQLSLEPHRLRGRFGRLLAFVQLPSGVLLNEKLLAAGLARVDDRFSHRWMERFKLIQHQAQQEAVGLWRQRSGKQTEVLRHVDFVATRLRKPTEAGVHF